MSLSKRTKEVIDGRPAETLIQEKPNRKRPRVIQALGWYFPESCGGTEVYVRDLVAALHRLGVNSEVAAPYQGRRINKYMLDEVAVVRYPVPNGGTIPQIRGVEPHQSFDLFAEWLRHSRAEIFHLHSWTMGCGLKHLRLAKELGMKTVTTVHVPGHICIRGTMMHDGKYQCDGKIDVRRCAACWATSKGVSPLVASVLASLPVSVGNTIIKSSTPSRFLSAVATPALVSSHKANFGEMVSLSDRLVAVCDWLRTAMIANGVLHEQIILNRQGVSVDAPSGIAVNSTTPTPLRIGFIGRWDRTKGIHLLTSAMAGLPTSVRAELTIYAKVQSEENEIYRREIVLQLDLNHRVRIAAPLDRLTLPVALSSIDVLAVPSQWLETGPLVVLEALNSGVPVVGSNLGGIAELVRDGVDGMLLPHDDLKAWVDAFTLLANDPSYLARFRRNIRPVRTMDQVAADMLELYEEVIG